MGHVKLLILFVSLFVPQITQSVSWSGNVSGTYTNVPIDIDGDTTIQGPVHVQAFGADVVVTPNFGDRIVNCNTGMNLGTLYFSAVSGRTITFDLSVNSLAFQGGASDTNFLVAFQGGGTFIVNLGDNKQISFTSGTNTGGTTAVVAMDSSTVRFVRSNQSSADDVEVVVGPKSCFTYIWTNASLQDSSSATVDFVTMNNGDSGVFGNFILRIENSSSWVINGNWLDATLVSNYTLADINFDVPAGQNALMSLTNGSNNALGSLRVINENGQLTQLLIDPFFENNFTGERFGFILGANGELETNNATYLDYIGTVTNLTTCDMAISPTCLALDCFNASQSIKCRNASAFWVDGNSNSNSLPAQITMNGNSAIYFRSGVDSLGQVNPDFLVDPVLRTPGVGEIVFDVEGLLEIQGNSANTNGLNILSLEVDQIGCQIFVESALGAPTVFPARTFAKSGGQYLAYNSAAWLINNRMNVRDASIFHTDENHQVFANENLGRCDLDSEPTYIGGETFQLCTNEGPRPAIALYNAIFRFNTSAALTGVDIRVPNNPDIANVSEFRFYYNGFCIDKGYGRNLIMGTDVGSYACDGGTVISGDAHLDIIQESAQTGDVSQTQQLQLTVNANNDCITENVPADINNPAQYSVNSIYLANDSNISIGTSCSAQVPFELVNNPNLFINGDFFSFNTQGGKIGLPDASGTTGVGGIFVDCHGKISISSFFRASFSTMIVKSGTGEIDLPERQIYFSNGIGISNWMIDLNDPIERIIINSDEDLSNFNLDWGSVIKNCTSFFPYDPSNTPTRCHCAAVTEANLTDLPTIMGHVDQLQILRSRIGDQVNLLIDGGDVGELIFLPGCNPGEAPTGFVVLQDHGRVGLGTTHQTVDALFGSVVMGINGITICANGDGVVDINEDILINNTCHIVTGTSFGANGQENTLIFNSLNNKEIRVKSTGVLDLSMFDAENKIIAFDGNLSLVFEPGAKWVVGNGGTVEFREETKVVFEDILNPNSLSGTNLTDTDDVRVHITGSAKINMIEHASILIDDQVLVGIETDPVCSLVTTITWTLLNQSQFMIGNDSQPGGSLQIGDTQDNIGGSISFDLVLNGIGTMFQVNRQGFLGFGVGIVNKRSTVADEWSVDVLNNCSHIGINLVEGIFRYNQIFPGDNDQGLASLWVVGPCNDYSFVFNRINSRILGGANIALLDTTRSIKRKSVRSENITVVTVPEGQAVDLEQLAENDCIAILENGSFVAMDGKKCILKCTSTKKAVYAYPCVASKSCRAMNSMNSDSTITINVKSGMHYSLDSATYKNLRMLGAVCVMIHPGGSITCGEGEITLTNTTGRIMTFDNVMLDTFIMSLIATDQVQISPSMIGTRAPTSIPVNITAGVISTNPYIEVNIMSSKNMLQDTSSAQPMQGGGKSPQGMFDFMKVKLHSQYDAPKSTIAQPSIGLAKLGYVDGNLPLAAIQREQRFRILGGTSADVLTDSSSLRQGSVNINLDDTTNDINIVTALQGAFL
jgi:hypothetical protein